jgi:hypothetical protein
VVAPADVATALAVLGQAGETASIIGEVGRGTRGVVVEE